jgi:shikimate dehydrogenase
MAGASVTAPHKADAARAAQGDASVQRTGAANCLRFVPVAGSTEAKAEATNTDLTGLRRRLAPHVRQGEPALVLGAGGAARAAIAALQDLSASVSFAARDPAKAAPTAQASGAAFVPWDRRADAAAKAVAIVQATPVGSLGEASPLPSVPRSLRIAAELVYAGGPTPFQREAAAAGAIVIDGKQVLVAQAEDAWRFWFGADAPPRVMAGALEA